MTIQKLKVIFSKSGDLRFISHLDLVRLFQRASRRARLPVKVTEGFNPRLKISISRALRLGVESASEEAIFSMAERMDKPVEFMRRINLKLPEGVKIMKVEEIR